MAILRNVREDDYPQVIRVLNDWWGGRKVADMLPRLFFTHFSDTSYYYSVKILRTPGGLCSYDQYEQDLHPRTDP